MNKFENIPKLSRLVNIAASKWLAVILARIIEFFDSINMIVTHVATTLYRGNEYVRIKPRRSRSSNYCCTSRKDCRNSNRGER